MKSLIVIPARYHSSRFVGKPLAMIAGKTMLQRVVQIAQQAAIHCPDTEVVVATDDKRIIQHANDIAVMAVMTSESCKTGSDRALAACKALSEIPEIVINLQGDAPLTPPSFVSAMLKALVSDEMVEVVTPVVNLSWIELDEFRLRKQNLPFSGTTVVMNENKQALWFSKQILPAIRKEQSLRNQSTQSPVYRHVGLYGYRYAALERFVSLPEGQFEALEGLEQLRLLENNIPVQTVLVDYQDLPRLSGVDTPEDAAKTEQLILAAEGSHV